jgi:hypothetical protein
MTKHIRIEVNGAELVNGEFSEISFTDGSNGVKFEAKNGRISGNSDGNGLLDLLTKASKARTADPVVEVVGEAIEA